MEFYTVSENFDFVLFYGLDHSSGLWLSNWFCQNSEANNICLTSYINFILNAMTKYWVDLAAWMNQYICFSWWENILLNFYKVSTSLLSLLPFSLPPSLLISEIWLLAHMQLFQLLQNLASSRCTDAQYNLNFRSASVGDQPQTFKVHYKCLWIL